jgi:DNA-binding SARP family transcriptional activator
MALLALQRGRPISADRLIDALWGDGQFANTANAPQAQIGQLRGTLGATAIVASEAGYALDVGPDDLDAARFEQLVAKGRRLLQEERRRWPHRRSAKPSSCDDEIRSVSSPMRASLMPSGRTWTT